MASTEAGLQQYRRARREKDKNGICWPQSPATSPANSLRSESSTGTSASSNYTPSLMSCGTTATSASSASTFRSSPSLADSGYYSLGPKSLRSTGPSPLSQSVSTHSGYCSSGTKSRSSSGTLSWQMRSMGPRYYDSHSSSSTSSSSLLSTDSGYYSNNSSPAKCRKCHRLSRDVDFITPQLVGATPLRSLCDHNDMRTWSLMMLNSSSSDGGIGYQQVCSICHESMPEKFSSLPNLELPQQQPRAVLNVSQDVPKSTVPVPAKPQDNLDTSGPDTEQMLNTVQSSAGGDFGFNADAALAVSSSLWHHGTAITLQEITSKDSFYSSPADLIAVQALQQAATRRDSTGETKTYVCPEVSCLRVFVRKSYYDSHLKSKHAGIPINADKTLSGQPSPRPDTRDPSPKPEGRVPVRERTPTILPTPKITEIASFRNVTDSPSTKQKTETVSEWLEDVQTNGIPATPTLRSATCPDSQQSVASGLTPQSMSLCKSYSTASAAATDSPCFESEGEAYFVLGDDVTTSATPYEPDWPTLSPTVLAQELVTRYFAHKSTPADTPAEGVESSSQASSASSTSGQTHTTANPSSVTTPPSSAIKSVGKRSLEDDEGDGSRRHKRPRLSDGSSTNAGEKLLACPYAKFDPRRYSEQNESEKHYRGCSSCYLRDIARLKQHLYRVHRRPEHHCPTCFTSFDSTVLLHAHIVARTCQQRTSPFEEKMTPDQVTAIRRRGMGRSRSESWNEIYKILFPDSPLPLNPYIESVHAETLQDFMAYVERDGQQALVSEINQRMFGSVQASSEEEQQFVERVISESVGVLLQRLDARFRRESSES